MAAFRVEAHRPYRQVGLRLPVAHEGNGDDKPPVREWPPWPQDMRKRKRDDDDGSMLPITKTLQSKRDKHIAGKGFLLIEILKSRVFVVQSLADSQLYINKIAERLKDVDGDPMWQRKFAFDVPEELRISTYEGDKATTACVLPNEPMFPKLKYWQQLDNDTYSLYFEHCNGGDLQNLLWKYYEAKKPVPEHFIWLVAEQLSLAFRYFYKGIGPRGNEAPPNWKRIYHRDLTMWNVFIHWPRQSQSQRVSGYGNAFPQIVLGDFGESVLEGDDLSNINPDQMFGDNQLRNMDDVYELGCILRQLCMAHISMVDGLGGDSDSPDLVPLAALNAHPTKSPGYSDELINLLANFEGFVIDPPSFDNIRANEDWIVDVFLPAAQAKLEVLTTIPDDVVRITGYFDHLDVSWTKPQEVVPFRFSRTLADPCDQNDGTDEDFGIPNGTGEISYDLGTKDSQDEKMKNLRYLRALHNRRPKYQPVSLEWGVPLVRDIKWIDVHGKNFGPIGDGGVSEGENDETSSSEDGSEISEDGEESNHDDHGRERVASNNGGGVSEGS